MWRARADPRLVGHLTAGEHQRATLARARTSRQQKSERGRTTYGQRHEQEQAQQGHHRAQGRSRRRRETPGGAVGHHHRRRGGDRKSTRLNSSHVKKSYADFCLIKKKITLL